MKQLFFNFTSRAIYSIISTAILFAILFQSLATGINTQREIAPPHLMSFDFSTRTINTNHAGNTKNYSQNELSGFGLPAALEVTPNADFTPPVLQSFSFSPVSINTGVTSQTVTVTARITDDDSGFNQAGGVRFQSPSGQQFVFKSFAGSRISGDARDGIYQLNLVFPQNSETGAWRVASVSINDFEINNRIYSTIDLATLGFPTDLQVNLPTAARVLIGGRVTTASGRGVSRARVLLTDTQGVTRIALTNPFGYYCFITVTVGETYILNVTAKSYQFSPLTFTVLEQTTDVNFMSSN